jgi:hypothetical protein
MKVLRALFVVAIAVLGMWALGPTHAHAAGAGTVSYTQTIKGETDTSASTNPCTGVSGTLVQTYNAVSHVTYQPDGEFWATFTQTGAISFVPDDPTQPTYAGHFTAWGGFNGNQQNQTSTFTLNVHVTGTDGSVITQHEIAHFTVTPAGVTFSFDKPSLTCG